MTDTKTIKAEELSTLQDVAKRLGTLTNQIGELEVAKSELLSEYAKTRKELNDYSAELEKFYGNVQINLSDGTIREIPSSEE